MAGQTVPFGPDLIFAARRPARLRLPHRDLRGFLGADPALDRGRARRARWCCATSRPRTSSSARRASANCCAPRNRRVRSRPMSIRPSGPGESTTDLAWDGQGMVHELGELIAETERFELAPKSSCADVDLERIRLERMRDRHVQRRRRARQGTPRTRFRRVGFEHKPDLRRHRPQARRCAASRSCPTRPAKLDADCYEAFNIQVEGLRKRIDAVGAKHLVIGVSGGLDSTHALIVAAKAMRPARPPARRHPRLHHARLRDRRGDQGPTPGR